MKGAVRLLPLVLGCTILGACGSQSNSITSESASQVAQQVSTALSNQHSVHLKGTIQSNGQSIALDLTAVKPKALEGSLSIAGTGGFKIATSDGNMFYLTPDDQFWQSLAQGNTFAVQLLSGKCISASGSTPGVGQLTNGVSEITGILSPNAGGELSNTNGLTKGNVTTVDGQQVLPLKTTDGSVLYIATQGQPLPVRADAPGGGYIDFSQWNSVSSVTTPTGCIDYSQLAQGLSTPTP
ncbi:MAG: hypothetical protein JOY68_06770 [Candidatus Dormibacteraeota bacterium]|nr:hypothetical protein [Candidatus Dormibacteraeota bacterium]MBV8445966.1 hypothetical protein [Candidatus Dormibacteraeota bacterium]